MQAMAYEAGGGGLGAAAPSRIFQIAIFGQKNLVIFGKTHLIFPTRDGENIRRNWSPRAYMNANRYLGKSSPLQTFVRQFLYNLSVA